MDHTFPKNSHITIVISLLVFGIVFPLAVTCQFIYVKMLKCQIQD